MKYNIGRQRKKVKDEHRSQVYEAIYHLGKKVTTVEIWNHLNKATKIENDKIKDECQKKYSDGYYSSTEKDREIERRKINTITIRTIERCIASDSRIEKEGDTYFISNKARYVSRYLDPDTFGLNLFRATMRFQPSHIMEEKISEFINRFGAFIFFSFIEAVRPSMDNSLSVRDREDLVTYWAQNAIPISDMLLHFQAAFGNRKRTRQAKRRAPHKWQRPFSEMKDKEIAKLLASMKRAFPEIYEDLRKARRQAFGKTIKEVNGVIEDMIDDSSY